MQFDLGDTWGTVPVERAPVAVTVTEARPTQPCELLMRGVVFAEDGPDHRLVSCGGLVTRAPARLPVDTPVFVEYAFTEK